MAKIDPASTSDEREQMRRWLDNWAITGPLLEAERRERVAALTDAEAWAESQGLLNAWQPDMTGDAGEALLLQQAVFARWQPTNR